MKQEQKLNLLLGLFVTALICANLLGVKITTFFGVSVSVGILMVPLTFLITDIVAEVFGKKKAKEFVKIGAISLIVVFFYAWFCVKVHPAERYTYDQAYTLIFSGSLRMIAASLVAFMISQYHDVWAFEFWKKKTEGKRLWLRNNASTIVSQFIDTTIFMFIAFYNVAPKFNAWFIFTLIIPYWLFKVAFAALDTPLCYWGVRWLKRGEK